MRALGVGANIGSLYSSAHTHIKQNRKQIVFVFSLSGPGTSAGSFTPGLTRIFTHPFFFAVVRT